MAYSNTRVYYAGKSQASSGGAVFLSTPPLGELKAAQPIWAKKSPMERAAVLLKAAAIFAQRNDELALMETHDTGRYLSETISVDIASGVEVLEFFAHLIGGGALRGEYVRLGEEISFTPSAEPLGVCAGIGAWNYPIQMALWKSAPCLAAGNSMVYKPSEITSLHGEILAKIYTEAGLPAGCFNVVNGGPQVGSHLVSHPDIAKVSFTGQVSTGQKVAAVSSGSLKYVTMELGGKSPLIVLPDCPVDKAVDAAFMANFYSNGQICTNGTRVFVPQTMLSDFERVAKDRHIRDIHMGSPTDMKSNHGPLVSQMQLGKVREYIRHGIEKDKAQLLVGGLSTEIPRGLEGGYWVTPTVFTDCRDDMKIVQEEIFGPVMCVLPYTTVDEAVQRANATKLGLGAGVFSSSVSEAQKIAQKLQAGIVWVNTWGDTPAQMPVGGWKQSGIGVENGKMTLAEWTQNRSIFVNAAKEPLDIPFRSRL